LGRGVRQIDLNRGHSRVSCALTRYRAILHAGSSVQRGAVHHKTAP
jgi:hypothetical protein